MRVYLNGKMYDGPGAGVSVFDHGFLYGDGVTEEIRVYSGRVFKLEEHLQRLFASAHAIALRIPLSPRQTRVAILETCRANDLRDGHVCILITRGVGTLGINPADCSAPSVIILPQRAPSRLRRKHLRGIAVITAPTRRTLQSALNPCIRSLNALDMVLATIEARNQGYETAIMLNAEGYAVEAASANVFIVRGGCIFTPPLAAGCHAGITRDTVFDLAHANNEQVLEANLTRYDLYNASECFLTSTHLEIQPVVTVDGRTIGAGIPGKITKSLAEVYSQLTLQSPDLV